MNYCLSVISAHLGKLNKTAVNVEAGLVKAVLFDFMWRFFYFFKSAVGLVCYVIAFTQITCILTGKQHYLNSP